MSTVMTPAPSPASQISREALVHQLYEAAELEHNLNFRAGGEPPTVDGPLQVRGNMEIISGTGRVVARVESAKLCRCGGSKTKPFCDGTHAQIGFKS